MKIGQVEYMLLFSSVALFSTDQIEALCCFGEASSGATTSETGSTRFVPSSTLIVNVHWNGLKSLCMHVDI